MAAPKSKKQVKKRFFEVTAPITSTKISLYSVSPESLENKIVKIDLTKNLKGKSMELKLIVKNDKDHLIAEPKSLILLNSYLKRVMRKGTDYVEDSFEAESEDSKIIIKPILITRKRVSRAILKTLREAAKKHLTSHIKTRNNKDLFTEITTNKLQKELSLKLKKVYPLALCEIKHFEVVPKKEEI